MQMTEHEAKAVLDTVLKRYGSNSFKSLADAANQGERIGGKVAGPRTGELYPIIISTEWAEDIEDTVRVTVIVHDDGAKRFDPIHGTLEKSDQDSVSS